MLVITVNIAHLAYFSIADKAKSQVSTLWQSWGMGFRMARLWEKDGSLYKAPGWDRNGEVVLQRSMSNYTLLRTVQI